MKNCWVATRELRGISYIGIVHQSRVDIHFAHKTNLKPLRLASPGTASPTAMAPFTDSPRSSFLLSLTRTKRSNVAIHKARKAITQFTAMATIYRGPADSGYIYDAYIEEAFETALIAARAAARYELYQPM